jgi:uncharacterized protein
MIRRSMAVAVLALTFAAAPRPAPAQFYAGGGLAASAGNIEGFTVAGKGSASAKPNRFEIDLNVSASSELTADAIVKYRDAKQRLQDAFAALKLDNVAVEERGLLVDQKGMQASPYFFDAMPARKAKTEVQLTRKLVVKCSNIRGMEEEALLQLVAKLLDVAQDAGGRVGPVQEYNPYYYNPYNRLNNGLVRFILDDYEKLEEEAYEKAIADAGTRAKRLAKLSGVELGPVSGVREAPAATETVYPQQPEEETSSRKRLESPRFQEIPVRVELVVRYEVAGSRKPNGKAGD